MGVQQGIGLSRERRAPVAGRKRRGARGSVSELTAAEVTGCLAGGWIVPARGYPDRAGATSPRFPALLHSVAHPTTANGTPTPDTRAKPPGPHPAPPPNPPGPGPKYTHHQ